jgi:hypothetical protein
LVDSSPIFLDEHACYLLLRVSSFEDTEWTEEFLIENALFMIHLSLGD